MGFGAAGSLVLGVTSGGRHETPGAGGSPLHPRARTHCGLSQIPQLSFRSAVYVCCQDHRHEVRSVDTVFRGVKRKNSCWTKTENYI